MRWLWLIPWLAALPAQADMLVAARTLRAQSIVTAADLILRDGPETGLSDPALVIGQETRVTIYAGRPLRPGDVGPPAIVERNQVVPLVFESSILRIETRPAPWRAPAWASAFACSTCPRAQL